MKRTGICGAGDTVLRKLLTAAPLAAAALLALAACGRPDEASNVAEAVAAATTPPANVPPGPVVNQTLEQVLDRTMYRFAKLDLNGDGKLSPEELNAATQGGDTTAGEVEHPRQGRSIRAFAGADANGDGVITRAEARAEAEATFKTGADAGRRARAAKP